MLAAFRGSLDHNHLPSSTARRTVEDAILDILQITSSPCSLAEVAHKSADSHTMLTLPDNICPLSSLQALTVQAIDRDVTLPENTDFLSSLRRVSVNGCCSGHRASCVHLLPTLGSLTDLRWLDMDFADRETVPQAIFCNLSRLECL